MTKQMRTVLCVSVDSVTMQPLAEALEQSYQVRTAEVADAALAIMSAVTVDLVIFDCSIAADQRETLLKSFHNVQPFCKIILIGDKKPKQDIDSFAVHGWCQKPVDLKTLLATVHSLINDKKTAVFLDRMTDQSMKYSLTRDEDPDSHKQYARFLETFKVGVCLVDAGGLVEYVNKKGCELLEVLSDEKLIGVSLYSLFRIDAERERHFLQKYLKREWTPQPLIMIRPDGADVGTQANITFSESDPPRIVTIFFSR